MKLSKKVRLITGGSKGIGEAVVRLFFNEGAQVIFADLDEQKGSALVKELNSNQGSVSFIFCIETASLEPISKASTYVQKK